ARPIARGTRLLRVSRRGKNASVLSSSARRRFRRSQLLRKPRTPMSSMRAEGLQDMTPFRTLLSNLVLVESPRWHDDRLVFSDWGTGELLAVGLDGAPEVITH